MMGEISLRCQDIFDLLVGRKPNWHKIRQGYNSNIKYLSQLVFFFILFSLKNHRWHCWLVSGWQESNQKARNKDLMSTFDSKYKLANDPRRLTAKQKPANCKLGSVSRICRLKAHFTSIIHYQLVWNL